MNDMNFYGIITGSGIVGILLWAFIFSMLPAGVITGIISTINSFMAEKGKTPCSFIVLVTLFFFYLFIGMTSSLYSMSTAVYALGNESGAAKAAGMAMSISNCIYSGTFTIVLTFPFIFFIVLSIIFLHLRAKKESVSELNCMEVE